MKNKGLQRMRIKEKLKKGVKYILPLECFSIPSALLSGLYSSPTRYFVSEIVYHNAVGSVKDYGFPLPWLRKLFLSVYHNHHYEHHYRLNPQNLFLDILFWSAVYGLPILGYKMLARSKREG